MTFANGKQSFRGLTLLAFIGQNGGTSKTYSFSVGDVIRMESEEQNGNGFICRCGKAFNGVRSIQKHGKRCKFIPTLPSAILGELGVFGLAEAIVACLRRFWEC